MNTIAFFCGLVLGAIVSALLLSVLIWRIRTFDDSENDEYYNEELND